MPERIVTHCFNRKELRQKMILALGETGVGNKKSNMVGMLKGIHWCEEAWRPFPAQTIEHCWLN
jgi:hypothetical protein